jgi:hypothetical protein
MRIVLLALMLVLCLAPAGAAQKRKKKTTKPSAKSPAAKPAAPSIGSSIVIVTRNGDHIEGELLDLSPYSVRIRAGTLESAVALETIASISFADPRGGASAGSQDKPAHPDFAPDSDLVLKTLQTFASDIRTGLDYTEYGRQLTDLRRKCERFTQKYSGSESAVESRVVALVAGALTDYQWARTVWGLKLGRSGEATVAESESPAVADTLALYPELRSWAAVGDKFSADKLVAGLWKKASERAESARAAIAGSGQ